MSLVPFDRLMTRPLYRVFGTSARLTMPNGDVFTVSVIDQSDGGKDELGRGQQASFTPFVSIQAAAAPADDLVGAVITLAGRDWRVQSQTIEALDGEFSGDLLLEIAEA